MKGEQVIALILQNEADSVSPFTLVAISVLDGQSMPCFCSFVCGSNFVLEWLTFHMHWPNLGRTIEQSSLLFLRFSPAFSRKTSVLSHANFVVSKKHTWPGPPTTPNTRLPDFEKNCEFCFVRLVPDSKLLDPKLGGFFIAGEKSMPPRKRPDDDGWNIHHF